MLRSFDRVNSMLKESEEILKKHGYPIKVRELELIGDYKDSISLEAAQVIFSHHYLMLEIQKGRAKEAAGRMFDLLKHHQEMALLSVVPELEKWPSLAWDSNEVFCRALKSGLMKWLKISSRRAPITKIQTRADELRKQYPDYLIYQIRNKLQEEFDVSESLLTKKIKIKKRKN